MKNSIKTLLFALALGSTVSISAMDAPMEVDAAAPAMEVEIDMAEIRALIDRLGLVVDNEDNIIDHQGDAYMASSDEERDAIIAALRPGVLLDNDGFPLAPPRLVRQ